MANRRPTCLRLEGQFLNKWFWPLFRFRRDLWPFDLKL